MFIRLVTTQFDPDSHRRQGVFVLAYALAESGQLDSAAEAQLRNVLDWFKYNLVSPRQVDPKAIFWFKADATAVTKRIWDLVEQLRSHGVDVEMLRTVRPGYVVYEDAQQIAAIPFRDSLRT